MNDPLQDERISAYLDGEMTAQERAEFERLLADDPERRQLLDELRVLSSTLGGLPKQTLDNSFSQQVLRKAERVVLTQSAPEKQHGKPHEDGLLEDTPADGVVAEKEHAPQVERPGEPVWPIGYSRRGWAWASLAVAAALVLMITLQRDPVTQLAKNQLAKTMEQPPAASRVMLEDGIGADDAAQPDRFFAEHDDANGDLGTAENEDRVAGTGSSPTARPSTVADESFRRESETPTDRLAAKSPESTLSESAEAIGFDSQGFDSRSDAATARSNGDGLLARDQVMVVHLDIRASAANESRLNQVLLSNGIVCDANAQYGMPTYRLTQRNKTLQRDEIERDGDNSKKRAIASSRSRGVTKNVLCKREDQPAADAQQRANEDVVYVEASYGQIAQALKQLHDNVEDFPAVEVDAAPDILAQQALVANSRGRATNRFATLDDDRSVAAAPQLSAADEAGLKEESQPLKESEEVRKGERDKASQLAGDTEAAHSSASVQAAKELAVVGTPFYVQLRDAFADSIPAGAGGEESARATRVPAQQRAVAEQIVVNRRQQLGRQFVDVLQQKREGQQQPARSQLGGRRSHQVQVLFILNVVQEPAALK